MVYVLTMSEPAPAERTTRKQQILDIAARLFARHGYRGTLIREIGEQAGILGGSLYHHIKSKDALFIELHNRALDRAEALIEAAVSRHDDPWDRLEAACRALLEIQLAPILPTQPLMNDFREVPEDVRLQLVARRDAFEGAVPRSGRRASAPAGDRPLDLSQPAALAAQRCRQLVSARPPLPRRCGAAGRPHLPPRGGKHKMRKRKI